MSNDAHEAGATQDHQATVPLAPGTPIIIRPETTVPTSPPVSPTSFEFWTPILAFAVLVSAVLALVAKHIIGKIKEAGDNHKLVHDAIDKTLHQVRNDATRAPGSARRAECGRTQSLASLLKVLDRLVPMAEMIRMPENSEHSRDAHSALGFLDGGGRAAGMIRDRDWSTHPLGDPAKWPDILKTALSLVLNSPESMILAWGQELSFFFNEAYFPLLGPRLETAMGSPFEEVWPDAWEQAKPIIADAFAGRSQRFDDLPWKLDTDRGPADTWFTFSYSRVLDGKGEVVGLFIFTNETTRRVLADRALAESQRRLEQVNATLERDVEQRTAERDRMWNTSPDLMVVVGPDGTYRRANPAWSAVLGYPADELPGIDILRLVHPDDWPATADALTTARAGTLRDFENRLRHRDGDYRWIQWVGAASETDVFALGRDVTAAKEAEARLQATEGQLRQAQKMEAVGQLTGGLAHDFNNLLTAVTGGLELLGHRLATGQYDKLDRYMSMALTGAQRAAALTQRLLAFSRRQTLAPTATDTDKLVVGMMDIIDRTLGPAIELKVEATAGLWPVLVDAPQLENALLNLCINARDAMPDGGRLIIETGNRHLDQRAAAVQELPAGDYVSLCVTDTGTGMPPEVIERVFDPFFTTKPLGEGTGLGLSMIYGFVRQSGGQVRIYSEVGHGTTMCLYLPRLIGEHDLDDGNEVAVARTRADAGQTVLLVEDEVAIRELVVEVLEDAGYRVLTASTGPAGIAMLQSQERIDLLITDVGLPGGLNGRQVADAGRAVRTDLKVLFVTGYAANAAIGAGHLDPGMSVLTKPFNILELERRVAEILAV